VADAAAATELVDGLEGSLITDETPWDRGDVRATRRALAIIEGVEVEILVEVESVTAGVRILGPPGLDNLDNIVVNGRRIPVLPLSTMLAIHDATKQTERAAMVREAFAKRRI
jgi:hypothetical protein